MDFNNITFDMPKNKSASIKVIGVGGGGSNAVNYMFQQGITGVDFVVSNTDAQALSSSPVPNKVQLGASITEGLGAGANPEIGEQAALESMDDIKNLLDTNTKMVFITAGMGGGTGTGAAPIIASIAKEMGILTVGICTAPFYFEGKMRLEQAKKGIEKFRTNVDSLIIINNDKLRELYGNLSYKTGFAKADEVLSTAAKGIAEVITHHYSTNIDLRDAKTVLADSGTAIMGSAKASGEDKAKKAIELALDSPLLNDNKITGAQNVLLLIVSGSDEITMDEIGTINDYIQQEAGNGANIIMGIGEDEELGDSIGVTVIATGFPVDQHNIHGDEEQQIVHTLDDDEPFSNIFAVGKHKPRQPENPVTDAPKNVKPTEENPSQDISSKASNQNDVSNQIESSDANTTIHTLEDDEPYMQVDIKMSSKEVIDDLDYEEEVEVEEPKLEAKEQTPKQSKVQQRGSYTLFTLDEDWEEEVETPISINSNESNDVSDQDEALDTPNFEVEDKDEVVEEVINEVPPKVTEEPFDDADEDLFNSPISSNISEKIKERRERLKKFNFKFKTQLNEQEIDEVENTPAYKRKNVELNVHQREKAGGYIVDKDTNNETKIRPNNFLHDNVD